MCSFSTNNYHSILSLIKEAAFMTLSNILAKDIMTKNPVRVTLDDRLRVVKELFENNDFRHLLVEEEGKLIGILSDRDLYRNISPNLNTNRFTFNDLDTLSIPVHRVVTRKPISIKESASLKEIIQILTSKKISALPVVDDNNVIVGIISWKDVLNEIQKNLEGFQAL